MREQAALPQDLERPLEGGREWRSIEGEFARSQEPGLKGVGDRVEDVRQLTVHASGDQGGGDQPDRQEQLGEHTAAENSAQVVRPARYADVGEGRKERDFAGVSFCDIAMTLA